MGIAVILAVMGAMAQTPAEGSCLERVAKTLELARADIGAMVPVAEKAAALLAQGGKLYAAGQPSLVSEISGRAGGIMMIRPLAGTAPEAGDVVLIQATPERFNEIARFKALTGKTWNHPVVAHGKLFVRNAEEAACFELPIANSPTIGGRDLELPTGVKSLAVSGHYAHLSLLPQSAWHRAI